ncbi:Hpt domain-containing protein [Tenacibaculum sp. UWU-22]|uniref:Hpt domain-containing protein n=1 Tax=Tenacibaculum sp. UWU-22 TaxID=3234187 RepID=UPI0034DADD14
MEQPNLLYIEQLSGGDVDFQKKILSIIKEEFPIEKQAYLKSIELEDFETAALHVHKLKHKISIFGLEKSYRLANEYENNLKENKSILKKEFHTILSTITEFLKKR